MPILGGVAGTVIAPGIGTMIGASLGSMAGGAMGIGAPKAPAALAAPAPLAPMPTMDDKAVKDAAARQALLSSTGSGRASTILSSSGGSTDKLGG